MRVLFDNNVPARLRRFLVNHDVDGAARRGWNQLENGALLKKAEFDGFEVFITGDKDDYMPYEKDMQHRKIALVVLGAGNWPDIQKHIPEIVEKVDAARPGQFLFIDMPLLPKPEYKPQEKRLSFEEFKASVEQTQQQNRDDIDI